MRTHGRLQTRLLDPVRTPRRVAVTGLVLAAVAVAGWYAERVGRFNRRTAAAERALAGYDFPAAREALRECLRLRPDDPKARLLAAQAARRDGDLDEAEAHLARYRERAGTSTREGVLESSLQMAARGRVNEVVDYLVAVADIGGPDTEQILEALAVGCVHLYQLDRAGFWVNQLLTRFPANPVGRLIRAQTSETLGNRGPALETYRGLVADYPGNAKARLALAAALARDGRYDEAAEHYRELRRQRPDDLPALLGLARCLDWLGRDDEVGPLMAELEGRYADRSEALLECGRYALKQRRPADAERLLRRAADLAPNDAEVRLQLGVALGQLGRPDEAAPHLARAKEIEADLLRLQQALEAMVKAPADPGPRLEAGRICLRNGQDAEALRWLSGALELAPDHKPTHQALADYFAAHGDPQQAALHRRLAR